MSEPHHQSPQDELHPVGRLTSMLWGAAIRSGLLDLDAQPKVYRDYFPVDLLAQFDRNLEDSVLAQRIPTLVGGMEFERSDDMEVQRNAYEGRPRTRVYEGIDVSAPGWHSLVSLQLARLSGCRTVCSAYESSSNDEGLDLHTDQWEGLILQLRGEKSWKVETNSGIESLELRAGDLMTVPEGVPHLVSTPSYSLHLVFAIIQKEPITLVR